MRWLREEIKYWKGQKSRYGSLLKTWRKDGDAQLRRERQHKRDTDNAHRLCLVAAAVILCQLLALFIGLIFDLHPRFQRYDTLLCLLTVVWSALGLVGVRLLLPRRSRLLNAWQYLFWLVLAGLTLALGALDLIEQDSLFRFVGLMALLAAAPRLSPRQAVGLLALCLVVQGAILWDLDQGLLRQVYCAVAVLAALAVSLFRFAAHLEDERDSGKLSYLVGRDPLTGLYNRRGLQQWVDQHELNQCPVVCGFLDLDFFKAYNDSFGHKAGDRCLQQVANIVQGYFSRDNQAVCRFGGEELVVLQLGGEHESGLTDFAQVKALVESRQIEAANKTVSPYVTVSIGFSYGIAHSSEDIGRLIEEADRMLYRAKRDGRNRVASASSGKSYL